MIRVFVKAGKSLVSSDVVASAALPREAVWIDLINPTAEEDKAVEIFTGISIPTREDMREIEESSRIYDADGAHYMTAPLLHNVSEMRAGMEPITFILTGERLITLRYSTPRAFDLFALRIAKGETDAVRGTLNGKALLIGLLESVTDRMADLLEDVALRLEMESNSLFSETPTAMNTPRFREAMRLIGREGAFLGKVGESLSGLERMTAHLAALASGPSAKAMRQRLALLDKDMQSLGKHAASLETKVTFLLDAVVGLVSVEQNAIIKIFSVAAVAFMPPTLVASIYGMNFVHMPELEWPAGYPWALGLMVLSAVVPLAYFRFKKWL